MRRKHVLITTAAALALSAAPLALVHAQQGAKIDIATWNQADLDDGWTVDHGYDDDPAFDPGAETYDLPYTMSEVQELGPFDYSKFQAPMAGGMPGGEITTETEEQQG